jgi:hypothetical protein
MALRWAVRMIPTVPISYLATCIDSAGWKTEGSQEREDGPGQQPKNG